MSAPSQESDDSSTVVATVEAAGGRPPASTRFPASISDRDYGTRHCPCFSQRVLDGTDRSSPPVGPVVVLSGPAGAWSGSWDDWELSKACAADQDRQPAASAPLRRPGRLRRPVFQGGSTGSNPVGGTTQMAA